MNDFVEFVVGLVIMSLFLLLVGGCGVTTSYNQGQVSDEQWHRDTYECERDATYTNDWRGRGIFQRCMESKGYRR
jgi:hypothetical protein